MEEIQEINQEHEAENVSNEKKSQQSGKSSSNFSGTGPNINMHNALPTSHITMSSKHRDMVV